MNYITNYLNIVLLLLNLITPLTLMLLHANLIHLFLEIPFLNNCLYSK